MTSEAAPVGGKEPLRKELHARIQDFFMGGVHARRGKMIQRDFSNNDDRGGPTFFQRGGGGVQLFPGGVKMLISIEPHITCDFSGRVHIPYPPSGSAHELIAYADFGL